MILAYLSTITRYLVFVVFVVTGAIAATHWAVRNGHLQPFGALPRAMRRLSDPLIKPLERRLVKSGGNPSNAPYYLFGGVVLAGLALIGLVSWLIGLILSLQFSAAGGTRGLLAFALDTAFSILMVALFIRVFASWFGVSRYSRPMRIVYGLTDWLVEPLRKVIPPFGMFDLTPMVAWLMLWLAQGFVRGLLQTY